MKEAIADEPYDDGETIDRAGAKAIGTAIALLVSFLVGASIGSCTGYFSGRDAERGRAMLHGFAAYELDPHSGRIEFHYGKR